MTNTAYYSVYPLPRMFCTWYCSTRTGENGMMQVDFPKSSHRLLKRIFAGNPDISIQEAMERRNFVANDPCTQHMLRIRKGTFISDSDYRAQWEFL